ncbi:hypothetical protein ACIQ6K_03785 [Streptomyces sp. NPDC096354]
MQVEVHAAGGIGDMDATRTGDVVGAGAAAGRRSDAALIGV